MIGLVPRDYWEHRLGDLFQGFAAALSQKKQEQTLYLSGLGNCIPVRSGRAALVAAIRTLNLPPGSHLGVPLYCCPVVFTSILAAGCKPRFIDIDPATFCLSAEDLSAKRSHLEAVLAVHMFGNMCDMASLETAAQGKPIVEDCAQSLGSKFEGRVAGTFGTIAFYSFRSGKYLSVGEGGALFSSSADVRSRVSQLIDAMPSPTRTEDCIHVAKTYIKSLLRSRPLYGVVGYSLWMTLNKQMNLSENSGVVLSKIHRSDLAITSNRLPALNEAIEKQRANADFYSRTLKLDPNMVCVEQPRSFYNRYHYPVTFPSLNDRDLIAAYLHSRKIDTMKYLDNVVEIAAKYYEYKGDCPVAEQLSKRVLIIPSYHSLKKRDLRRIADCLNVAWTKVRSREGRLV